jgi:quinoprotein glucose dehydrogenase
MFLQHAFAIVAGLLGCAMGVPGLYLLTLGGSAYYVVAGFALIASAILLWRDRRSGALLFGLTWLGTLIWALWEAGLDGWALLPRLLLLTGMGVALALIRWQPRSRGPLIRRTTASAATVALLLGAGIMLYRYPSASAALPAPVAAAAGDGSGEWPHVGRTVGAERFSPLSDITPANVSRLEIAWTAHVGMPPKGTGGVLEATPLMIGDTLYTCNMNNVVLALEAETGIVKWRSDPKVNLSGISLAACRGVTYHRVEGATGPCSQRIVQATYDGRLIAVDALTGLRCAGFGTNGEVSLLEGMGNVPRGYYYVTSPPALVRGKLIVGGAVMDNQTVAEPSGVIRAFDAVTGRLAWAWDLGRPGQYGLPPAGQSYTPGTPNGWGMVSGDEQLGLAFVPLGNPTPDFVTAHRTSAMRRYGSALVAIDVETGRERWHFQTTHLDVWDYDLASPPSLVDFPTPQGLKPALIQPTKRAQFFVLDRRTGQPLVKTVERPVPQAPPPGVTLSATQPYPIGMPSLADTPLTETRMWGVTPLDQLWCRIRFREARYDGEFTVTGTRPSIQNPGVSGGSNWSGISIDPERRILIANVIHLPTYKRLIPRSEAAAAEFPQYVPGSVPVNIKAWPQNGTSYAATTEPFLSPLSMPCRQPPYAEIAAIDLKTRRTLWRQPLGRATDTGPMNVATGLPFLVGTPALGGSMVTKSGLVFIAATQERAFRAFDTRTGQLLWEVRLPAGGHANPMSFRSPKSGRQFIMMSASGHPRFKNGASDQLIAYALPRDR